MDAADKEKERQQYEEELVQILFSLKERVLSVDSNGRRVVAQDAAECLQQILEMIGDLPKITACLVKWKFIEGDLPFLLRTVHCRAALALLAAVVKQTGSIPHFYLTKPFLFFITERLYARLKLKLAGAASASLDNLSADDIIEFVATLVSVSPLILQPLYNSGFFILANLVLSHAVCALYNTIFKGIFLPTELFESTATPLSPEALFEIRRRFFLPEIIFRDKEIIRLKQLDQQYKGGIYQTIYNECTSMRHLMDMDVLLCINMLAYKPTVFMNEDFAILIREKGADAIRAYRRTLEAGALPDASFSTPLLQALESGDTLLDATLALFYSMGEEKSFRGFSEARIRQIFSTLEFQCSAECPRSSDGFVAYKTAYTTGGSDMHLSGDTTTLHSPFSFEDDVPYDKSFASATPGRLCDAENKEESIGIAPSQFRRAAPGSRYGTISDDPAAQDSLAFVDALETAYASDFQNPQSFYRIRKSDRTPAQPTTQPVPDLPDVSIHKCNRMRIVKLLGYLYNNVPREYFYKPSFLVLLRCQVMHCYEERPFIEEFMADFIRFVSSESVSLGRVFFPAKSVAPRAPSAYAPEVLIPHVDELPLPAESAAEEDSEEGLVERIVAMKRIRGRAAGALVRSSEEESLGPDE